MEKQSYFSQAKSLIEKFSLQFFSDSKQTVAEESDSLIVFVDTEISPTQQKICDIGATTISNNIFHNPSITEFERYAHKAQFICGHNIIHHDLKYLYGSLNNCKKKYIDTLFLSPLLFPKKPYHKLLKDDKICSDEFNNPVNDSIKSKELFFSEIAQWEELPPNLKTIFHELLKEKNEFKYFFEFIDFNQHENYHLESLIFQTFNNKICANASLSELIRNTPVELAYALALINVDDYHSITPPWLIKTYPEIEFVIKSLRNTFCNSCSYCIEKTDVHKNLKQIFNYEKFRTFEGEPIQENAIKAAVKGESLLTIFPTGGGKSLTFQLPAIMSGRNFGGLTIIISPLQSLMKDQVDNLTERNITDAVTINGLLDPISRSEAIRRVEDGMATMLYISPEMLRSKTIERIIMKRNVVRFVIDEAHCFSSWGHDFRVDYMYIADFIKNIQEKKSLKEPIPVSCFTATAKQKVVTDICDYFKKRLNLDLKLFTTSSNRTNLRYKVFHVEDECSKYNILRQLMSQYDCPTIVYVSRTKKTHDLAQKLTKDGFPTLPFNGKMDSNDKITNQNKFINNEVRCIVATSAFGMGVDKKDVGLVIHFDISDSLENYVQEAGRAGRDPEMQAQCFVLYSDNDLDKHFILLNQTKLSISEIQQVWTSIKRLTGPRKRICCSALEIARQAGWDEHVSDIETRVKTAISALENAGYISRGYNVPRVFATGIIVKNMDEAREKISLSKMFDEKEKENALRIIKSLISSKNRIREAYEDAESRIDYIADTLGIEKESVINAVEIMRQENILADSQDMTAYISANDTLNKSKNILDTFIKLESFLLNKLEENNIDFSYKELNASAQENGIHSSIQNIRTLLHFLMVKGIIKKEEIADKNSVSITLKREKISILNESNEKWDICRFILNYLYTHSQKLTKGNDEILVQFSLLELLNGFQTEIMRSIFKSQKKFTIFDIKNALLYLSQIKSIRLEGGFLVLYNAMEINKLAENRNKYKIEDYKLLNEFYKQKIQQIHIVGEYANLMTKDYNAALQFVQDYFLMDYKLFISKYFKGEKAKQIEQNITQKKYLQLFGELSERQREIISDKSSKYIVVAAGPGSGKTKLLVHKLASLLLLEDVKHEQLLMLTFSRAAASEFKKRLINLIGNAANYVEIKTFHSYCFDLIGKMGNLDDAHDVVKKASKMIESGEVEQGKINKSVLVIDEAQDMDADEFALVQSLMKNNEEMRVIAVGDDDQNIFQFRGADSKHLQQLIDEFNATKYELTDNYRSCGSIVSFANSFVQQIPNRMKTTPINAVNKELGLVELTLHNGKNLEIPMVNNLCKKEHPGSVGVLTRTNEEALLVIGLLKRFGIRSQLIQSVEGFRFSDLAEIRYFIKNLELTNSTNAIINGSNWEKAKQKTFLTYERSTVLPTIRYAIEEFEKTNSTKYKNDFLEFLYESNLEDFHQQETGCVTISTIHKSKGREFDEVYLLLNKSSIKTDEEKRLLYVAFTRAKKNLYIHSTFDLLVPQLNPQIIKNKDPFVYPEPNEITIHLTHKDVYLDFFKDKKKEVLSLMSGDKLQFEDNYILNTEKNKVASLSKRMKEVLKNFEGKGYTVSNAHVLYIVAWKGQEDTKESAVLLASLTLYRTPNQEV